MSYTFPDWVEKPARQKPEELATKRLRFIVSHLCAVTGSHQITDLARRCDVERTSIHYYIRRGRFSLSMATKIEKALGGQVVKAIHLTRPLEIKTK